MRIRIGNVGPQANAIARALRGFAPERRAKVAQVIAATCLEIERTAKGLAPVDTGRLRSSIRSSLEDVATRLRGEVLTDVDYAAYVELGTRRLAASPYLLPAFEAALPRFIEALRDIYRS